MKLNAALAKTVLMAASIGMVIPIVAAPPKPGTKDKPATTPQPSTPPKTDKAAPAAPKEEVKIPGYVKPRAKGGFISLVVESGKFTLTFWDADKKQVPVDVARASARWDQKNRVSQGRTVLNPAGDSLSLVSAGYAPPPYVFKLFITLLNEEGAGVENYTFDVAQ